MKTEPIIMIADETLSVQAQLGEALGKRRGPKNEAGLPSAEGEALRKRTG